MERGLFRFLVLARGGGFEGKEYGGCWFSRPRPHLALSYPILSLPPPPFPVELPTRNPITLHILPPPCSDRQTTAMGPRKQDRSPFTKICAYMLKRPIARRPLF